jgi:hypothetical protein
VSSAIRKSSRLKRLGNGKRISAVGKEARPKRMEGKRNRNRNGQRKLEQESINNQRVQRSGGLAPVSSRAPYQISLAPVPHPRHQPPSSPLRTHAATPPDPRYLPLPLCHLTPCLLGPTHAVSLLIKTQSHLSQTPPHSSFNMQQPCRVASKQSAQVKKRRWP